MLAWCNEQPQGNMGTSQEPLELLGTTENRREPLGTTGNHGELLITIENCMKPEEPKTILTTVNHREP